MAGGGGGEGYGVIVLPKERSRKCVGGTPPRNSYAVLTEEERGRGDSGYLGWVERQWQFGVGGLGLWYEGHQIVLQVWGKMAC